MIRDFDTNMCTDCFLRPNQDYITAKNATRRTSVRIGLTTSASVVLVRCSANSQEGHWLSSV